MSIGSWTQQGKWTANSFDIRVPSSLIHKEQPPMAETLALSVGVLAFIPALPSGSEVRIKEGAFSSQLVHKRSLRGRFSPLCDCDMVSVLIRHSAGTSLSSFKRR
jgi:hypothetical protein